MRVLLTGVEGQLGSALSVAFSGHDLVATSRRDLDVRDESAVAAMVAHVRPDLIVDAAAWTDVDACERAPVRAHAVNALGPWWLARAAARIGATLVTVSTDYVFGGATPLVDGVPRRLTEHDPPAPLNAYGRAKAAGEALVRTTLPTHHIVRTSWLCSASERNFLTAVLARAERGEQLDVVDDQHGRPTFVADLVPAIHRVATSGRYGTIHLANEGEATWYDLATAAVRRIDGARVTRRASSSLDRPAARPAWSVLDTTHADALGLTLPSWQDGLERTLRQLADGPSTEPSTREPA